MTDKETFMYIEAYLNILINLFKTKKVKKEQKPELYSMCEELDKMFTSVELKDVKRVGILTINRYIPVLELLLKIENNPDNRIGYDKLLHNAYKRGARISLEHYMIYREWNEKEKFFLPRYRIMVGYMHYLQELVLNPKFETVIANMPSGYGKTYPEKISEAWAFGINDTGTVLSLCSNENVVLGGSKTVMDEIKSEAFGEVFPHLKYDKEDKDFFLKETAGEWKLKNCRMLASYYATTVRSNVVGSRASARIHIDDLYSDYKEAQSQELNEYYFNKYLTVWSKRFVQNKTPKVCVTGTLWASGDFIAQLINYYKKLYSFSPDPKYPYTIVNEERTVAIIQVPALDYVTGESTCPEVKSTKQVLKDKDALEDYLFQTNFQQIPTDPEALCFAWGKLRTYQTLPKENLYSTVSVIDGTRKTGNDYFSMPIFIKHWDGYKFDYYMIDCLFTQKATKDMIDDCVEKIIQYKINFLVVETNVDGGLKRTILEKLHEKGYFNIDIQEHYSTENKLARIEDQKGNIIRNLVFPNKNLFGIKSMAGQFMNNLTTFNNTGSNRHDDAPDSCALLTREVIEDYSKPLKAQPIKNPFD